MSFCPNPHLSREISALHRRIWLSALLAMLPATGCAFELEEVAPGVFVHRGAHAGVEDAARADSANIGFVVGAECVAVIDSGGAPATGAHLLDAIRARTDKPVCYVINTHVHFDHLLGNAAFRAPGVRFVGHARLAAAVAASRAFFAENFAAELGADAAEQVIAPDLPVADRLLLDLGARPLELRAHAAAHTQADLSVFDRTSGTLWTGDLVFMERVPVIDGSLRGWRAVLAELEQVAAARVVPGHGPASAPWPAAAADLERYLKLLEDEVRAGIGAGLFLEDMLERAAAAERGNWLLFDSAHRRNVSRAFTELEWEP